MIVFTYFRWKYRNQEGWDSINRIYTITPLYLWARNWISNVICRGDLFCVQWVNVRSFIDIGRIFYHLCLDLPVIPDVIWETWWHSKCNKIKMVHKHTYSQSPVYEHTLNIYRRIFNTVLPKNLSFFFENTYIITYIK